RCVRSLEPQRPQRLAAHVAAALAPVVVDLEIAGAPTAQLHHVALPERRQLGGRGARRRTQRGVILHHDGERGGGQHHWPRSAALLPGRAAGPGAVRALIRFEPMRFEPMNCPGAGVGAMMTWTLSESLSARVFWMRSG